MAKSVSGNSTQEIEQHNTTIMNMASVGDLIEFPRQAGYSHWAIYVGNGMVIELTTLPHLGSAKSAGAGTSEGIVREAKFMEVAGSSKALINNGKDRDWIPRSPREIVATARSLIGSRLYHVLTSNCEHFAKFCRYGIADSAQAKEFLKKLESLGSNASAILMLIASFVVKQSKSGALHQ